MIVLLGTAWVLVLLAARLHLSHSYRYTWLVWDLALALAPWALALLLQHTRQAHWRTLLVILWLAFLPNAPYLATEFIHFRHGESVPYWLDLAMLTSFALLGLWLGARSMRMVFETPRPYVEACLWLAAGYGIYLGRVLRLNSWDLAAHPLSVLQPLSSPTAWLFTIAFGVTLQFYAQSTFRGRYEPRT